MKSLVFVVSYCLCFASASASATLFGNNATDSDEKYRSYRGDVIVDVFLRSDEDVRFVESLEGAEAWSSRSVLTPGATNRIHATHSAYTALLERPALSPSVVVSDLEAHLLSTAPKQRRRSPSTRSTSRTLADEWYTTWHGYDEIVAKLEEISAAHPGYATFVSSIGEKTHEGRSISAIRLGSGDPANAKVALLAGEHAREWAGPGALMWVLGRLAQGLAGQESVLRTRRVDVYVVPCYNPDGYEYSRAKKRLWRKNMCVNSDGSRGVDLNRNWDNNWCVYGGSRTCSYQTYCGTGPFSEPETRAVSSWILAHNFDALVDFHSYAGQILRPYGYKADTSPDEQRLRALAEAMAGDVRNASTDGRTEYEAIRGVDLYPASGASDDWAYENAGVRTVFTIEIAGNDFVVPESEIEKRGDELYPAVLRVIREASEPVHSESFALNSNSSDEMSDKNSALKVHPSMTAFVVVAVAVIVMFVFI